MARRGKYRAEKRQKELKKKKKREEKEAKKQLKREGAEAGNDGQEEVEVSAEDEVDRGDAPPDNTEADDAQMT